MTLNYLQGSLKQRHEIVRYLGATTTKAELHVLSPK